MAATEAHADAPKLEICNALWIGGDLGPVSAACLTSFVRRGHRVVLHCYDVPKDVPAGIAVKDAAAIVPSRSIIRHKETGSYALFSNLFRYELLRRGAGLWIDCDIYCLRPLVAGTAHVFGWEHRNSINGAVLKLPPDAPALAELCALFDGRSPVPPWLEAGPKARFLARRLAGETFTVADLPWGSLGPAALTYILAEAGFARQAAPRPVYYPLRWEDGPLLLAARGDLLPMMTPQTLTVHLWNQALSSHLARMQPGSPLSRLLSHGTLFDEARLLAA